MSVKVSGGSPVIYPQQYQSLPISVISQGSQQDRYLRNSELKELESFFSSGKLRLEIAITLTNKADEIVCAGANRIFIGGSASDYLEKPQEQIGLPGSGYYIGEDYLSVARRNRVVAVKERLESIQPPKIFAPIKAWWEQVRTLYSDRDPLPGGFRFINISRYGPKRMQRSMRDLSWFLRYITYAIVAGDASIIIVNARGLRGVIPEDVTEATVVALKEMRRQSVSYLQVNTEATNIIKYYFDILIAEYLEEKPSDKLRIGVSNQQQGLVLPQSYAIASEHRPKFAFKSVLSETEKREAIKAAYRQVFERDITAIYAFSGIEIESQLKGGQISMKEFVRRLGKSRLYRRLFYEPYTISRVIELAMRHFLGRGLSSLTEFQEYFAVITKGGLPKLIDALVDSQEYSDYFGEETVPYLRGLGQEAQECRNWGPQIDLFKYSAPVRKIPQFVTLFAKYQKPLPNQHPYGCGNDPLEIQFGAVFPQENRNPHPEPAFFNKDTRRILINCSSSFYNGNQTSYHQVPGSAVSIIKLNPLEKGKTKFLQNGKNTDETTKVKKPENKSINLAKHSLEAVIRGAYRQVFGRELLQGQRLTTAEIKLKGGEITVREFIRQLAKSNWFRRMYWEKLYITKAIEYIHRRLLGRPTYGRQEMNRYYDICATKGFYALIDEILNSAEYIEAFGENTVPYERYITPRGLAMRRSASAEAVNLTAKSSLSSASELDAFIPQQRNIPKQLFWAESAHTQQQNSEYVSNTNNSKPKLSLEPMTESVTQENYEYSQASDS
ncbi:MAG: photosystem I reaction center subunit XI [Richelia sp. SL_2_1]|nr:photosystem I reaction center subunit XI [Richelia sp. RM1_1_1]NJO26766.1 photosystem I reaction center subunit XI [Richelia sp. SL_2_1]